MSLNPIEQRASRVTVRDFGSGPCLATERGGATIVLIAHGPKARLRSCDDDGLLTEDAARATLEYIAELWNSAAEARKDQA